MQPACHVAPLAIAASSSEAQGSGETRGDALIIVREQGVFLTNFRKESGLASDSVVICAANEQFAGLIAGELAAVTRDKEAALTADGTKVRDLPAKEGAANVERVLAAG